MDCVKNSNGNHVIQKCIQWADPILLQGIVTTFAGKVSLLESGVHSHAANIAMFATSFL